MATTGDSEGEAPVAEAAEQKKKMDQSSPDSLASELNRDRQNGDVDGEDAGNMGDVEQVGSLSALSPFTLATLSATA